MWSLKPFGNHLQGAQNTCLTRTDNNNVAQTQCFSLTISWKTECFRMCLLLSQVQLNSDRNMWLQSNADATVVPVRSSTGLNLGGANLIKWDNLNSHLSITKFFSQLKDLNNINAELEHFHDIWKTWLNAFIQLKVDMLVQLDSHLVGHD